MAFFTIQVVDKKGNVKYQDSGESIASLVFREEYEFGDCILVSSSEKGIHVRLQVDDALGAEYVYLKDNISYRVPFAEKRTNITPKAFTGNLHYLYVRDVQPEEVGQYRNLAQNVCDQHDISNLFPHAWANVETRGEAKFFACNAIDGMCENRSHGIWPYQSWGINRQDDAALTIEFGRPVETDKIIVFTRADFPHDNWWTQITLTFSDGTSINWHLHDHCRFPQMLKFDTKIITWVRMERMIKANDPSPFPALSQIEVYGREVIR